MTQGRGEHRGSKGGAAVASLRLAVRRLADRVFLDPKPSILVLYGSVPVAVLGVVLLQRAVLREPAIAPFALFHVAVAALSVAGGRGPGLLAVAMSAAAGSYFCMAPYDQLKLTQPILVASTGFAISAAAVSLLCSALRSTLHEARGMREALGRSEATYRAMARSYPNGMMLLFDAELRCLTAGGDGMAAFGSPLASLHGRTIAEAFPELFPQLEPSCRAALAGERRAMETWHAHALHHVWSLPVRDEDGRLVCGMLVTSDITERSRIEVALRNSEERYRRLFQTMDDACVLLEVLLDDEWRPADLRVLEVNPAFEKLLGRPRAHIVSALLRELVPDAGDLLEQCAGVARTGTGVRLVKELGRLGRTCEIQLYRAAANQVAALFTDVSAREAAERALRESERRYRTVAEELRAKQELLKAVLDVTSDAIFVKDERGAYLLANRAMAARFGRSPEELVGTTDHDLFGQETAIGLVSSDRRVMGSGEARTFEEEAVFEGEPRTYLTSRAPYRAADDRIIGVVGVAHDITERKLAEATRLRQTSLLLKLTELLQTSQSVDEACAVIGNPLAALLGDVSGVLFAFLETDKVLELRTTWRFDDAPHGKASFATDECWALRQAQPHHYDGDGEHVLCPHLEHGGGSSLCIPLTSGRELVGLLHIGSASAIDGATRSLALMASEEIGMGLGNLILRERLRNEAIRDPLTGLFNRRYMVETLERELRRAQRHGEPLALIMIDIDHFKAFNDTHGHQAGDAVLVAIARLLRARTRASDVASRIGGEELLLVMPAVELAQAESKADGLRSELAGIQIAYGERQLGPVTVSMGVASYPAHAATPHELLRVVDAALYSAKRGGRNQIVVASLESPAGNGSGRCIE